MMHLDLLPGEIYITIHKNVMNIAIQEAVRCVLRKNLPVFGNKTNSRVVYCWMNDKPFKNLSFQTKSKVRFDMERFKCLNLEPVTFVGT